MAEIQILQGDLQLHMHVMALGRLLLLITHAPKAAKPGEAATPKEPAHRYSSLLSSEVDTSYKFACTRGSTGKCHHSCMHANGKTRVM